MFSQRRESGFSLLEIIGVLAIMGVMAGAIAPSVFQMIDEGRAAAEEKSLQSLGEALERYVTSNRRVPAPSAGNWDQALAEFSALPQPRIAENDLGFRRSLYLDPEFLDSGAGSFNGMIQSLGVAAEPFSPRAMIATNLKSNVPTGLPDAAEFASVWNQSAGALLEEDEDLKIERVNLARVFHRIVFANASNGVIGYSLETGPVGSIPAASGGSDGQLTRWVIAGTRLNLHTAPFPSGPTERAIVVRGDLGVRYESDGATWSWVQP